MYGVVKADRIRVLDPDDVSEAVDETRGRCCRTDAIQALDGSGCASLPRRRVGERFSVFVTQFTFSGIPVPPGE